MHILLINQFYPPDPAPTGRYLHDLAEVLAARGHQVTVICSRLSYADAPIASGARLAGGIREIRLGSVGKESASLIGKAIGYARFILRAWWAIRRIQPASDLVVALTTPPWIGWVASLSVGRRCRRVHWIMDLYPHVLVAHNLVRQRSPLYSVLAAMTRWEWRWADLLVTVGPGMTERVHREGVPLPESKVETVPLWTLDRLEPWPDGKINPLRQARRWTPEQTVLMFTGNMGFGNDIGLFLEAVKRGGSGGQWRLAFSGWGVRQVDVVQFIQQNPDVPVELVPPVASDRLGEHLCSADVLLASMNPGWAGLIVPCKLQAAFAVKRPVLFVGPAESDPARWIQESGGGWVVAEGDLEGMLTAVRECCDPEERRRRGEAAYQYSRKHFDRMVNVERWVRLLENLATEQAK